MSDQSERGRAAQIKAIVAAKSEGLKDLLTAASLDPKTALRNQNLSGLSLAGEDLRGIDFSRCKLFGCDFTGAQITGAQFHQAKLAAVLHDPDREPHQPALITPKADLTTAADWKQHCATWRPPDDRYSDAHLPTGAIFQDAPFAPEMVVVPSGSFWMGTTLEEAETLVARYGKDYRQVADWEQPRRPVTIAHRLAVGRFPVTFEEWDFCHKDNGTKHEPDDENWGRVRQPVINVSWDHITKEYLPWLNRRLGLSGVHMCRLLTEAEWEYCCRAGTDTAYSFGDAITTEQANFDGSRSQGQYLKRTTEVGTFPSNAWGLHDMHGNVWEWCQDVFHENYRDAPGDGSAREDAPTSKDKTVARVLRGGSWYDDPQVLRSASRIWSHPVYRGWLIGFRLARTLNP